jgi:CRP/FNR family transcriptional regulator, nitrogen oxide reductase regulator
MLGEQPGDRNALVRLGPPRLVSEAEASRRETLVKHSPLFTGLTASECREIVSAAHEKRFARRQTIFVKGDLVQQVILLTSGGAKTVQFTESGAEVILGLRGPGEVVGTLGLRPQDRHCSMAQALVSSTALVWDAAVFETFSGLSMHLRGNITHILCQQLHQLEERYREIATEKVAARLSLQLVRLIPRVGRRVEGGVEIRLSREELAQMTGTTLFTVSRLLSDWNQRGIVRTRREAVLVHNFEALAQLSEGAQDKTSRGSTSLNLPRRARTYRCGNDPVFGQVGRLNAATNLSVGYSRRCEKK